MKILKRNEVIIYAICLMLVTAGYFNYKTFMSEEQEVSVQTYAENIEEIEEVEKNEDEKIGEAVLVSSNEVKEEVIERKDEYYINSKIERDTMYATMMSSYESILNNPNANEVQKNIATQEIKKINDAKNAIMICENLILTKGFEECLIFINEKNTDVVAKKDGGLQKEDIAKIQNIITREIGTEIQNIHISEN